MYRCVSVADAIQPQPVDAPAPIPVTAAAPPQAVGTGRAEHVMGQAVSRALSRRNLTSS
ncbi:hypothetical protein KIPB_016480, partial [Kipferlia bialata]|eukprot:g16480.t1